MTSPDPLAHALAGAAVAVVRPGDTLIVAFARSLSADEATTIAEQFRAGIPDSIRICMVDQVSGLAVVRPDVPA